MTTGTVSAPGKIMLLGEYAVLEGAPAMVAAVNRRAVGRVVPRGRSSPVVEAVLARANAAGLEVEIDTSTFYVGDTKLGLGSSAAVAVVTAALAKGIGAGTLDAAVEGHRDANAGKGSGVDVAASFYGGVLVATRQPSAVERLPIGGFDVAVLFTGASASTKDFVTACQGCRSWGARSAELAGLTRVGIDAWRSGDANGFFGRVRAYHRAMAELGVEAGVPIVTEVIDAIARYAEEGGASAKPSGAGGGDVAVVFGAGTDLLHRIADRTGTRVVELAIDPAGVEEEP